VKERSHVEALRAVGADAAIVGSACVACLERAAAERRDSLAALADLLHALGRPAR
jgi:tryptophan synthase alpha chain